MKKITDTSTVPGRTAVSKKSGYHHGDLRTQLVSAIRLLVERDGAESFSIAEACRSAGVSTAAPYRHFTDREDMLSAVAMEGLGRLADGMATAGAAYPAGSPERIAAMGRAYVAFATDEPGVFRLVFAMAKDHGKNEEMICEGERAFGILLAEVAALMGRNDLDDEVLRRGFSLWTFVHGIAFLRIDGKFEAMNLDIDVDALIVDTSRRLLA